MKKIILNLSLVALAFGGISVVSAETKTPVRTQIKNEIQTIRREGKEEVKDLRTKIASSTKNMRDEIEEKRQEMASSTESRKEDTQDKIENRFYKMVSRLEATITREESIIAKIVSRIEKVKTLGGDTAAAEKLVTEAKDHITEAKTALEVLKTVVADASSQNIASTTVKMLRDSTSKMKKSAQDVEMHIRLGHKALEKSVGALRGNSQLQNATSTKEVEDKVNTKN